MRHVSFLSLFFAITVSCVSDKPSTSSIQDSATIQNTKDKDASNSNLEGTKMDTGRPAQDAATGGMGGAGGTGSMDAVSVQPKTGGISLSGGTTMGGTSASGGSGGGSTTPTGGATESGKGGGAGNSGGGTGGNGGSSPPAPTSTVCASIGSGANGSGSYTQYYFGQGTYKENGGYRTACGHFGKEPSGGASDTVENIANPKYFAAIPSNSSKDFDTNRYCGACAEVSGNGKSVIVTVIDACPEDTNKPCKANPNGHLDLSVAAMQAIGYTGNNLYPKNTSWKFVPCPVTGNVVVRVKPGNFDQIYIENTILPIKSVSMDGLEGKHLYYGTWQLPGIVLEKTITLTDAADRTITVVPKAEMGINYDTGTQFPKCDK